MRRFFFRFSNGKEVVYTPGNPDGVKDRVLGYYRKWENDPNLAIVEFREITEEQYDAWRI